jgi:TolB protein
MGGAFYTPQLSPLAASDEKGRRILFTAGQGQVTGITLVYADGSGVYRLTSGPGTDYTPAWSPDGSRIAYVSASPGARGLFLINPDGSGKTQLVEHAAQYPAWSPDGSRIAYVAPYQGASGIYVVNADPESAEYGVETPLTAASTIISGPAWSADGESIVFDARQAGSADIYRVALDGSGQVALTSSADDDTNPIVSPDGKSIAFLSYRDGPAPEIYVMDADGSHPVRLTSNPGNQKCLGWPF